MGAVCETSVLTPIESCLGFNRGSSARALTISMIAISRDVAHTFGKVSEALAEIARQGRLLIHGAEPLLVGSVGW